MLALRNKCDLQIFPKGPCKRICPGQAPIKILRKLQEPHKYLGYEQGRLLRWAITGTLANSAS